MGGACEGLLLYGEALPTAVAAAAAGGGGGGGCAGRGKEGPDVVGLPWL